MTCPVCQTSSGVHMPECPAASSPVIGYRASLHDWPEDFSHENGNYTCICVRCRQEFIGHKRRIVCKVCSKSDSPSFPLDHDAFCRTYEENARRRGQYDRDEGDQP